MYFIYKKLEPQKSQKSQNHSPVRPHVRPYCDNYAHVLECETICPTLSNFVSYRVIVSLYYVQFMFGTVFAMYMVKFKIISKKVSKHMQLFNRNIVHNFINNINIHTQLITFWYISEIFSICSYFLFKIL